MLTEHLSKLNDVVDPEHVARAEECLYASVCYKEVDRLPRIVACQVAGWPAFTYKEAFHDMEKMLLNELAGVWMGAHVRDDRMYTIRANYGVGVIASMFGCEIVLTEDNAMPWVTHLTDEQLDRALDAGPVDIEAGLGARVFETERFYLQALSEYDNLSRCVHLFVSDTQGPFDVAHLVMGHQIYTEVYDNPARVHRLLELTSDAYVRFTKAQKQVIGESLEWGFHYHGQFKLRGAGRACDDTGINLSTACYKEFSKPYNRRVFRELGGGWVHYCGSGKQILEEVLTTEGITAINFGNPEMQDLGQVYSLAQPRQVAIVGWSGPGPVPDNIRTGITVTRNAPDLRTARQMVAS